MFETLKSSFVKENLLVPAENFVESFADFCRIVNRVSVAGMPELPIPLNVLITRDFGQATVTRGISTASSSSLILDEGCRKAFQK